MTHLFRIVERASFVVGITGFFNATELHVSRGTWGHIMWTVHMQLSCVVDCRQSKKQLLRAVARGRRFIGLQAMPLTLTLTLTLFRSALPPLMPLTFAPFRSAPPPSSVDLDLRVVRCSLIHGRRSAPSIVDASWTSDDRRLRSGGPARSGRYPAAYDPGVWAARWG